MRPGQKRSVHPEPGFPGRTTPTWPLRTGAVLGEPYQLAEGKSRRQRSMTWLAKVKATRQSATDFYKVLGLVLVSRATVQKRSFQGNNPLRNTQVASNGLLNPHQLGRASLDQSYTRTSFGKNRWHELIRTKGKPVETIYVQTNKPKKDTS